jgi:hypothetical protein
MKSGPSPPTIDPAWGAAEAEANRPDRSGECLPKTILEKPQVLQPMKPTLIVLALAALVMPLHAAEGDKAPKKKPNPQQVFKKKDTDKNGSLSKEEFVNRAPDPAKAGKAFARKDKDGNGKLSLEEFKAAPKKKKP